MDINKINFNLKYKDYLSPDFNWNSFSLYSIDNNIFSNIEFVEHFKYKFNKSLYTMTCVNLIKDIQYCHIVKDVIDWYMFCESSKTLSITFLKTFQTYIIWEIYCEFGKLSPKTIIEFQDSFNDLCWRLISLYQYLTKELLDQFHDKIDYYNLKQNRKIPNRLKHYFKVNYVR